MKKEQSSNSTQKIKYALAEKYKEESEKKRQEEVDGYERLKTKEATKLPAPTGWRMLILPFKMKICSRFKNMDPWIKMRTYAFYHVHIGGAKRPRYT